MSTKVTKFCSTAFVIGNLTGVFPIEWSTRGLSTTRTRRLDGFYRSKLQLARPLCPIVSVWCFGGNGSGATCYQQWSSLGWNTSDGGCRMECTLYSRTTYPCAVKFQWSCIAGLGTDIALSLALFGDAMFNGLMGLSMILLGMHLRSTTPKLGWSGIVIGALTFFIIGQVEYTVCADLLKIAGRCGLAGGSYGAGRWLVRFQTALIVCLNPFNCCSMTSRFGIRKEGRLSS